MIKKLIPFLIVLLLVFPSISAAENLTAEDAYKWLVKQSDDGDFGSIEETVFSYLALRNIGEDVQTSKAIKWLKDQKSESQDCFPESGCKIKDTALAALALSKAGEDISGILNWLESSVSPAFVTGNWLLQIVAPGSGTCTVSYERLNQTKSENFVLNNGNITHNCVFSNENRNWLKINSCFESNLVLLQPKLELDVDCSSVDSDVVLTILYNSGNKYYIVDDKHENTATLNMNNVCFGNNPKGSCDYVSSLYSAWALKELGSEPESGLYLTDGYDKRLPLHSSFLYLIFSNEKYLDDLKAKQKDDGSFEKNVYFTALANLAQKTDEATEWLKKKQGSDGSWNEDVRDTALVLYSSFTVADVNLPSCSNGIKDGDEEGPDCGGSCADPCLGLICNNNGFCDSNEGENYDNCPDDCPKEYPLHCSNLVLDANLNEKGIDCGGPCRACPSENCNYNDVCNTPNENSANCAADCFCGDSVCDDEESFLQSCDVDCAEGLEPKHCTNEKKDEDEEGVDCGGSCTLECVEKKSLLWIYLLIVLIMAAGIVGYFYYFKTPKTKKKPPEKTEYFYQPKPKLEPKKTKTDEELDNAIKEAENVLKGK